MPVKSLPTDGMNHYGAVRISDIGVYEAWHIYTGANIERSAFCT